MSEVEKVIELAKRRGLFWPSYEIYGGVGGLYDIGPIGVRIKNKIVNLWRKYFVEDNKEFVVEVETPIITPYKVLEASGHVDNFTDPIVECTKCHRIYRADHLVEDVLKVNVERLSISELNQLIKEKNIKCPSCGGDLGDVRAFNLLFSTNIGPYSGSTGFLRPETAQGMFTSFRKVYEVSRERLPLGIAQVGRVARNEISPRQGLIRMREFTIMEVEFFFDPEDDEVPLYKFEEDEINIWRAEDKAKGEEKVTRFKVKELVGEKVVVNPWMAYWMATANRFVKALGISNTFFEEKLPQERAHYSRQTFDQIAVVKGERVEISGHAYRGDYDLSRHAKFSGQDLSVFKKYPEPRAVKRKAVIINKDKLNNESKEFVKEFMTKVANKSPEEIEQMLATGFTIDGKKVSDYVVVTEREEKETGKRFIPHVVEPSFGVERCLFLSVLNAYSEKKDRIVLSLPREVAPYEVAVFPLLERENLVKKAKEIYLKVREKFDAVYDDSGSIGRRYARVDEIGVPYAVTVDPQTLEDGTVTIRDRDTWKQVRVKEEKLTTALEKLFSGEPIEKVGEGS
ncbi:MAG: glycine--tRNA ligase [Candidatus Aramenus sp.]|nr:glycine--tRNA ligase [Candidatus Aramenus sp.]